MSQYEMIFKIAGEMSSKFTKAFSQADQSIADLEKGIDKMDRRVFD